jgi:hypothetical protein
VDQEAFKNLLQLLEPAAYAELEGTRLNTLVRGGQLQTHQGGQDLDFAADAEKIIFAIAVLKLFTPAVDWFFDWLKKRDQPRRNVHESLRKAFSGDKNIQRILDSRHGRILTTYLQGIEDGRVAK